ncbi:MAG: hypothetical protein ACWIPI_09345 [Polaribacter sp.]
MIKDSNYELLKISNFKSGQDILYHILLFAPLPLISTVIFTIPLYYSFKIKNLIVFIGVFLLYLILEYLIYTYLTSQKPVDVNGVYNVLISIIVFSLMFIKSIKGIKS